jgi:hypothetical protein
MLLLWNDSLRRFQKQTIQCCKKGKDTCMGWYTASAGVFFVRAILKMKSDILIGGSCLKYSGQQNMAWQSRTYAAQVGVTAQVTASML